MRTRSLIKTFRWREQDRAVVVLGPNTRIVPERNVAELIATDGNFPTDPDLFVRSRLTTPQAVRQWIGFEALVRHKLNAANEQVTSASFRLDVGAGELYWTGIAWAAAGAGQWSTEEEVANNIPLLSASERELRVTVNLATTDPSQTPEFVWVKVLYSAVIEFLEDITLRSLVPLLRQELQPISRVVWVMPADGSTIPLDEAQIETGYQLDDVDSCFDFDSDPDRLVDLLLAYDPETKVITLKQALPADTQVWIRFTYTVIVSRSTSQDFVDAATLPAIVLTDEALVDTSPAPDGRDLVANKDAGTAVVVPSPEQGTLELTAILMAEKAVDLVRLNEELNDFFARTPTIRSTGIDEAYRLQVVDEYSGGTSPQANQNEIYSSQVTFRIHNFRRWLGRPTTEPIVTNFEFSLQLG